MTDRRPSHRGGRDGAPRMPLGRLVLAVSVLLTLSAARGLSAQAAETVARGYVDGRAAGSSAQVILPFIVPAATLTTLAVLDDEPVTNNRVVGVLVSRLAIGAGVSIVTNLLLKAHEIRKVDRALEGTPPEYQFAWRSGYNDTAGGRRLIANMLGIIAGSGVSGVIYRTREAPEPRPRFTVAPYAVRVGSFR